MDHKTITFDVSERTLSSDDAGKWISFNDDYIAVFRFDSEWDGKIKTAEFVQGKEIYRRVIEDDKCEVPPLKSGLVRIGVYTSEMTSTPVIIGIKRSIKDYSGVPVEPPEDVYAQLTALIESGILKGADGLTPYVGENGNWWIGDIDTGVLARGTDGYTPVNGVDYFTEGEVQQIQNEVSEGAIGDFKAVVDEETNKFDANAQEKFDTYNANADSKFEAYNTNAETKFSGYNSNAETKLSEYNKNDSDKTALYNANAETKLSDYNENADNRVAEFDSHTEQIQTDISGLKSDLVELENDVSNVYVNGHHDKTTNYIDFSALIPNTYIKGQEQGQEVTLSGFYATDYIELEENTNYYFYEVFKGYFAFYDENKNYIDGKGNGNYLANPFTIPSGAKYGRFTIIALSQSGNNWIYTENSRPPEYRYIDGRIKDEILTLDEKTNLVKYNDNPLGKIIPFAGYGGIIRKWGIIGDSLSSGEMQCYDADGNQAFLDMYQYSWGQHFARIVGADCYNFSNGGQTAYGWVKDYGTVHDESYIGGVGGGTWATAQTNLRDGYIIALGVNDLAMINRGEYPLGDTTTDIKADYNQNAKTFVGYYAGIIQRIKTIQPKAKFFCVTPLGTDYSEMNTQIKRIVANFGSTYLIDLDTYAPKDRVIDGFMLQGHLSPLGYMYTAYMINTYIDWIIKNNAPDFIDTALIGTTYKTTN